MYGHDVLAPHIDRADNACLFDGQGRQYIDLESGVWCTPLGHCHPAVLQAITGQSARVGHVGFCWSSKVVEQAAERVLSLLGFTGGSCVFLCSGSEAVEYCLRAARTLAGADKPLLTLADSYFGAYGSAHKDSKDPWLRFDWLGCEPCPHDGPCSDACESWQSIPFSQFAGFLFEPGSSSGMVRFPPVKLIQAMAAKIQGQGGWVIVNEVTTGMGRTGKWFGYEHYGLSPDMAALGKGVGNGFPVSVAAFSPPVAEHLSHTPVPYAQSHQNDATGAAVVQAVIKAMEEQGLIQQCQDLSDVLLNGLGRIKKKFPVITAIRGRGLMIAVDLDQETFPGLALRVQRDLVERGYILTHRSGTGTLRLDPCLTIEEEHLRGFLAAFQTSLAESLESWRPDSSS